MDINIHQVTGIKSNKNTYRTGDDRFYTRTFTIYYTKNGEECQQEFHLYADKWHRLEIQEESNGISTTPITAAL